MARAIPQEKKNRSLRLIAGNVLKEKTPLGPNRARTIGSEISEGDDKKE
jgi:hypothetical protein